MSHKTRKAAPKSRFQELPIDQVPLEQPDRSGPQAPTLLDLARARQAEMDGVPPPASKTSTNSTSTSTSAASSFGSASSPDSDHPGLTAITHGITLAMLHTTLDILVHHQYAQHPLPYGSIVSHGLFPILPLVTLIVYMLYSHYGLGRYPVLREAICCVASVAAGVEALGLGSKGGYMRVMRQAPGVGTAWIGCTVVLGKWSALVAMVAVGAVAAWRGVWFW